MVADLYNRGATIAEISEAIVKRSVEILNLETCFAFLAVRTKNSQDSMTYSYVMGKEPEQKHLPFPYEWPANILTLPFVFQGKICAVLGFEVSRLQRRAASAKLRDNVSVWTAIIGGYLRSKEVSEMHDLFLATVSHEVRTPLNGIIGMTRLMLDGPETLEHQKEKLKVIYDCGFHLVEIISDILDFSRMGHGKLTLKKEPMNLHKTFKTSHELLSTEATSKGIALHLDIDEKVPKCIVGDATRLKQVIVNILNNAVKFTPPGGSVSTRVFIEDDDDDEVYVEIEDTGIGIQKEHFSSIFRAFQQIQTEHAHQGTGLGLAICKKLIQMMEGRIWIKYSVVDKGTCFAFCFPIQKCAMSLFTKENVPPTFSVKDKTALILDQNTRRRLDTVKILLKLQMNAIPCGSKEEISVYVRSDMQIDVVFIHTSTLNWCDSLRKHARLPMIVTGTDEKMMHFASCVRDVQSVEEYRRALFETVTSSPPAPASPRLLYRDMQILIVEDCSHNQVIAVKYLNQLGYDSDCIDVAVNGRDAVRMASRKHYDVIFMDLKMPVMNGYEATKQILQQSGGVRPPHIFAMTAYVMDSDRQKCIEVGMKGFLPKPVVPEDMSVLLNTVRSKRQ